MTASVSTAEMFAHVAQLMTHSPLHKRWALEELFRLILPPMQLNQAVYEVENGKLVGFGTFAILPEDKARAFLRKEYRIQPNDFKSGNCPVLVDAIAPFGHANKVTRKIRNALIDTGYRGVPILFRRDYGDKTRISEAVL